MDFKAWLLLTENGDRTGAKIGLYPPIMDILGQYPPLWGIPKAADMITYYNINYPNGIPGENGIIRYQDHPDRKQKVHHHLGTNFKHHTPAYQEAPYIPEPPARWKMPD